MLNAEGRCNMITTAFPATRVLEMARFRAWTPGSSNNAVHQATDPSVFLVSQCHLAIQDGLDP